jgi:two-component system, chemotaxis family, chemotaxis protein CheY
MPKASSLQVLIVDDQASVRALVRSCLLQLGCSQVIEAEDGRSALARLKSAPVQLIISDLNMAGLDGLGLLRAVRESDVLKALGFIMLTSRGDDDLVRQAVALKVNNYLMKPFSIAGLRSKIESVVGPLT